MYMSDLWRTVDNTISEFVGEIFSRNFILWKNDILYEKILGDDTDTVLCGSKTIVSVPSRQEADCLEKRLRTALEAPELLVEDAKTLEKRPFKLKIKIIECPEWKGRDEPGYIFLKKAKIAVTEHGVTREKIAKILDKNFESAEDIARHSAGWPDDPLIQRNSLELGDNDISIHNKLMEKLYRTLKPYKYCISGYKPYARNYRVTYNDICGRRKTTAVGDVLIAINGTKVLADSRLPKKRSDTFATKHVPIFYLGTPFEYYVYNEYKVDK